MAAHSSILAWESSRTEEPGDLVAKQQQYNHYTIYIYVYIYIKYNHIQYLYVYTHIHTYVYILKKKQNRLNLSDIWVVGI